MIVTIEFDEKMTEALDELKEHYGMKSHVQVLGKALNLLLVAKNNEQPDGSILISDPVEYKLKRLHMHKAG
jgi:predicted O-methyltransferase YrrM